MISYDPRAYSGSCITLSVLFWLGLKADLIERLHSYFLSVSACILEFLLSLFVCFVFAKVCS